MRRLTLAEQREAAIQRGNAVRAERKALLKRYPSIGRYGWRPIENLRRAVRQLRAAAARSPLPSRYLT